MNLAEPYPFKPEDRPVLPGGPFTPPQSLPRRLGYGAIGVLAALAATFGNALVSVNLQSLAGSIGLYAAEASLLIALFFAMNASTNLLLIKSRIQFGIPRTVNVLLLLPIVVGLGQFLLPGLASTVAARAASGLAAGCLSAFSIYNLMQALPPKLRPASLVIGVGLLQLGTPLARLVPVEMLTLDSWQSLHLIELGMAALVLAGSWALPLPPSERSRALQPLDFVSAALIATALTLLCLVLAGGRLYWWQDTPWLGWALVAAVPLFALAVVIELHRERPLLQIGWITGTDILILAGVSLVVRLSLSEQTFGAVGLLASGGLISDQMHTLFMIVAAAMVAGIVVAVLTLSPKSVPYQVMAAALIIATGAWLDSGSNHLTRPAQLYVSQALLGFGTTLFIGPAIAFGMMRVIRRGPDFMVSWIVLFSITQNVGSLLGAAALGSYQVASAHAHAQALSEHLVGADPHVAARLHSQGPVGLAQALAREANALAFNDVFVLVACVAVATALFIASALAMSSWRKAVK
jgi:hypothetical protein